MTILTLFHLDHLRFFLANEECILVEIPFGKFYLEIFLETHDIEIWNFSQDMYIFKWADCLFDKKYLDLANVANREF